MRLNLNLNVTTSRDGWWKKLRERWKKLRDKLKKRNR